MREDERTPAAFLRKLALTQDRQQRLKVLKAYARLDSSLAERVLVGALADPCEEVRDFIVRELVAKDHIDLDLVCNRLAGPPWYARSAVLRIIGLRKAEKAVRYIERVIDDANADVRKCAADALGSIGGREVLALLVRLKKDANPVVRQAAEEGLRKASEVRFA